VTNFDQLQLACSIDDIYFTE